MGLPTLFVKGNLRAVDGSEEKQKELDEWLPIDYVIKWFKDRQDKSNVENRFLVLKAETSSGKSTGVVAEIFKNLILPRMPNTPGVIVTQPRTLTAIRNVSEIVYGADPAYRTFLKIGETIGWSTKHNKLRPKTYGVLSATVGTLTQQLKTYTDEEIMQKYRYILIDETHERDLQIDMTLYMLKNFLIRNASNPRCPFVVLMSATFEPVKFVNYYGGNLESNFIWVGGMSHGIDERWDWNQDRTVSKYTRAAADVVEKIVCENPDDPSQADILIFMPGKKEIDETAQWVDKLNEKLHGAGKPVVSVIRIDSEAQRNETVEYKRLDIPVSEHYVRIGKDEVVPTRRVIISTNVAETGLTLPNLKYVIDAGFNKEIEFNPNYGIRGLVVKPAPVSRIIQRRGRAGRKFPGVFYPLYPRYIYDRLPKQQLPQILLEDISPIIMDIITEQMKSKELAREEVVEFRVEDINMLDPPTPDAIHAALEKLYALGFIDPIENGKYVPSELGRLANEFSHSPIENLRMIFSAWIWQCSPLDLIAVAVYLGIEGRNFVRPSRDKKPVAVNWTAIYSLGLPSYMRDERGLYRSRLIMCDDFITGAILFNAVKSKIAMCTDKNYIPYLQGWCESVNLSYPTIIEFIRARDELIEQFLTAGMDIYAHSEYSLKNCTENNFTEVITKIKYCIYDGWRLNSLDLRDGKYYTATGLEIVTPPLFAENELSMQDSKKYDIKMNLLPQRVLYRELTLKEDKTTGMFKPRCDRVSAMDGYVNPDDNFMGAV